MLAWIKTFFTGLICDAEGKVSTLRCLTFGGVVVITLFCLVAYAKDAASFSNTLDILKFLFNIVLSLAF